MKPQLITIHDKKELYRSYMPFLKGGGLFLPFTNDFTVNMVKPGQTIFLILEIPAIPENRAKVALSGKVVYISKGTYKGCGISFSDSVPFKQIKANIENTISEFNSKKEPTYTF